jgi:NAD(P)-dependent dehydrogenase (short-subunit alcohol dehydrogenase family)
MLHPFQVCFLNVYAQALYQCVRAQFVGRDNIVNSKQPTVLLVNAWSMLGQYLVNAWLQSIQLPMTTPIALVTGGNRGIGFEVCRQLADKDYTVILGARNLAKGETAAQSLGDSVIPKQLDVTSHADIDALAGWLEDEYGHLDVLINNAAIDYDTDQNVLTANVDRVEHIFATNVFALWRLTQAFIPLLRNSAHPRVVNVSSESGALASMTGSTPGYSLSKLALNGLTQMLASQLEGMLVNAVDPGWTATDMGGGGRPIAESAKGVVWAAMLEDGATTGGFFRDAQALAW